MFDTISALLTSRGIDGQIAYARDDTTHLYLYDMAQGNWIRRTLYNEISNGVYI